jgi:hypothetical protein
MLTKWFLIIGGMAALSLSSGCGKTIFSQNETPLDKNWGRSFEEAKYNQLLNPDAKKNLSPVVGLDGEAARRNLEKYETSFEREAPEPTYNIDFGSMGSR